MNHEWLGLLLGLVFAFIGGLLCLAGAPHAIMAGITMVAGGGALALFSGFLWIDVLLHTRRKP